MPLFDTHAHLTDPRFDEDRQAVLDRMRAAGVDRCVVIGEASDAPERELTFVRDHPGFFGAFGVHPHEASHYDEALEARLLSLLADPNTVAVGEIGLDYHYDLSPRDVQRRVFLRQLDLALARNLPCVLHIREAHGDATELLTRRAAQKTLPRCVFHCYGGSWESAKVYLALGCYISFTGSVTFKNAPKLWNVAQNMPLDRLMIETDCPYMAPVPLRGQRNEPSFVRYVAEKIAALRGISPETVAQASYENGLRFFQRA